MMEIRGLGGAGFERVLDRFRAGAPVSYRGMVLLLQQQQFECRVTSTDPPATLTDRRALAALTLARFRVGALLANAPPLAEIVGNREPRFILAGRDAAGEGLYELRRDRLRRLGGSDSAPPAAG